jgi:hypothetical protein
LVWRVKLVADLGAGPAAEIEVAQIEREDWAVPETLGLTLAEESRLLRRSKPKWFARKRRQ